MNILEKLLQKRNIKSPEELSLEEKKDFENWRQILSKDELTTKDIKDFCQSNIDIIEGKWRDLNLEQSRKAELIPYHTVYRIIHQVMDAPKTARIQLEQQLNQLL